jgi:glycosyltransferase involved in cell wall biosynthesis
MEAIKKYKTKKEPLLLPTGIDGDVFYPREKSENDAFRVKMEEMYPQLKGKDILLFAGRVGKEKNIGFFLEIAPEIIKAKDDVVFLIVGNGPDIYWFKEECEERRLAGYFVFTGYVERNILACIYGIAKIFVFPSLSETQGLVTIEAMLSAIPVVAIGERGTVEVMKGDKGGFMVKNDPKEFIERVLDLLRNEELYQKKAFDARENGKLWTIDIMSRKLLDIYSQTIADYKSRKSQ